MVGNWKSRIVLIFGMVRFGEKVQVLKAPNHRILYTIMKRNDIIDYVDGGN